MSRLSFLARPIALSAFLLFFAFSPLANVFGYLEPILVGADLSKDSLASMDILEVYLTNNGTHFRFIVKCRSVPEPSATTAYQVYLDIKSGAGSTDGIYSGADYYLEAKDDSYLYEWRAGAWKEKSPIEFEIGHDEKIISLTAELSDIGYQNNVDETIGIVVATSEPSNNLWDRAPDTGDYAIAHEVIPELPWPTPLVFILAVIATISILHITRFKNT